MAKSICLFCGKVTELEDPGDLRPWTCEDCHEKWGLLPVRVRGLILLLLSKCDLEPQEAIALIEV